MTVHKVFILRERKNAEALWAFLKANWEAMAKLGKPLQIEIGPEKTQRSIQANRRYWAIVRQISEQGWLDGRQFSQDAWHEHFKREFIGLLDLPGGKTVGMSSASLTVEEFCIFTTRVEAFAAMTLGVELLEVAA